MEQSQIPAKDFAQHEWLQTEAAGIPDLLELLVDREHLIDKAVASGAMDKPEISEKIGAQNRKIVEMKTLLGIPLHETPNNDTNDPRN